MEFLIVTQEHETRINKLSHPIALKQNGDNVQISIGSKQMSVSTETQMHKANSTTVDQLETLSAPLSRELLQETKSTESSKRKCLVQDLLPASHTTDCSLDTLEGCITSASATQEEEEPECKRKKHFHKADVVQNLIGTTPISKLYNAPVYVTVGNGEDAPTYDIHQGLLCNQSSVFHRAFTGSFTEAQTGHMALPYEEPKIFNIVYSWLYTGKLTIPSTSKDGKPIGGPLANDQLVDVYIFGDKFDMPRLRNAAINGIIRRYEIHNLIYKKMGKVYENTPRDSLLRKLMVAIYTCQPPNMKEFYEEHAKALAEAPEFLLDVIGALTEGWVKGVKPWGNAKLGRCIKDRCLRFHEHGEDDEEECA